MKNYIDLHKTPSGLAIARECRIRTRHADISSWHAAIVHRFIKGRVLSTMHRVGVNKMYEVNGSNEMSRRDPAYERKSFATRAAARLFRFIVYRPALSRDMFNVIKYDYSTRVSRNK